MTWTPEPDTCQLSLVSLLWRPWSEWLAVTHTGRSLVYKQKLTSYQTVILIELFLFVIQRFPPPKKKIISLLDLGVSLVDVGVIKWDLGVDSMRFYETFNLSKILTKHFSF